MREKLKVIIIGAGGHGKVVADAIIRQNEYELIGFVDDNKPVGTLVYENHSVVGSADRVELKKMANAFVVAVGNNKIRKQLFDKFKSDFIPVKVIHPFAVLAYNTLLGEGTVVLAGVVINPSVTIGENCIINSQCLIDHDVIIEANSHIGQGAIVGSGNRIEEYEHVQQGANRVSKFH